MAGLEEAFNRVASKFGIQALNSHQQLAISKLIERKKDIFVNLPTGSGKSLIFQALSLVIDHVSSQPGHICVVSPLLTLVDDQVEYLRGKGVTAASISSCTEEEATVIEKAKISVVFGSWGWGALRDSGLSGCEGDYNNSCNGAQLTTVRTLQVGVTFEHSYWPIVCRKLC